MQIEEDPREEFFQQMFPEAEGQAGEWPGKSRALRASGRVRCWAASDVAGMFSRTLSQEVMEAYKYWSLGMETAGKGDKILTIGKTNVSSDREVDLPERVADDLAIWAGTASSHTGPYPPSQYESSLRSSSSPHAMQLYCHHPTLPPLYMCKHSQAWVFNFAFKPELSFCCTHF